jgi:hypothetical protein
MVEKQKGHSLVVGAAGGASCCRLIAFIPRTSRKTAKATIRKLMIALKKSPKFMVTAPAAFASATPA